MSDALRAILDGHIVLSRALAHRGHYPAIDVLRSVSRLMPALADAGERSLAAGAVALLAELERNRALIDIGAYESGTRPQLDRALQVEPAFEAWLRQDRGGVPRTESLHALRVALDRPSPGIEAEGAIR